MHQIFLLVSLYCIGCGKGLGYPGEIGYQTFLYSSVKEWRKLLMFLIEKLPKETTQAADEPAGAGIMLGKMIAAELEQCLASPWTPSFCKKDSVAKKGQDWWLEVRDFNSISVCLLCCCKCIFWLRNATLPVRVWKAPTGTEVLTFALRRALEIST